MVLKSYKLKVKKKKKKRKAVGDLVTGGITALVGVALLSETSQAINRI
jgi:predicted nucleic acid-binding protein